MILPAQAIRRARMIKPFYERKAISGLTGGLGPAGYDVTLDQDVVLYPVWHALLLTLASTQEEFSLGVDVCAFVCDKSSLARLGITVKNTFCEPGWRGFLTIEMTYNGRRRLKLPRGTPIANMVFARLEEPTELPYSDKDKYQDQERGPVPARMSSDVKSYQQVVAKWKEPAQDPFPRPNGICPQNDGGSCVGYWSKHRGELCPDCPRKP